MFEEEYEKLRWGMIKDYPEIVPNSFLTLFHYTNNKAFFQIIQNNRVVFRFTEGKKFADKNEGILILEPFRYICNKLRNKGVIDESFYEILNGITKESIIGLKEQRWILCLSNNGNSKYLKERYAPRDGRIIGIQFLYLEDLELDFDLSLGLIDICRVEYGKKRIEKQIEAFIIKAYKLYEEGLKENSKHIDISSIDLDDKVRRLIVNYLDMMSYCYKSETYKNEEEIRIIITLKDGFKNWTSNEKSLYFEQSDGEPHLFMSLDKDALYHDFDEPNWVEDKHLNKCRPTSDEIKAVKRKNDK